MNTAFDLEVLQYCLSAGTVYYLFHVVAKFVREVMDRARFDQVAQLKELWRCQLES